MTRPDVSQKEMIVKAKNVQFVETRCIFLPPDLMRLEESLVEDLL